MKDIVVIILTLMAMLVIVASFDSRLSVLERLTQRHEVLMLDISRRVNQ